VDAADVGIDVDVLDIGGGGEAAILASRRGASVIGLDRSPENLRVAAERAVEIGVPVDWMEGTPEDLPCPPESMDWVISALGLEGALVGPTAGEVMRVLRPGGGFALAGSAGGDWGDEAGVRAAFEPYGVELAFDRGEGYLLARGRRMRTWPLHD
jgi:ubiquinone/menaquinone biosynthesis C-methylase UbiE